MLAYGWDIEMGNWLKEGKHASFGEKVGLGDAARLIDKYENYPVIFC